jgi:hypothetical protein
MKYMIVGTMRDHGTAEDIDRETERLQRVAAAWSPADPNRTVHAFVMGVDGNTNWMIVDTDDVEGMMRDLLVFAPWLEQRVIPVVDIEVSRRITQEALTLRQSALG